MRSVPGEWKLRPTTPIDEPELRELFVATLPGELRRSPLSDLQWRAFSASLERYGRALEDHAVLHDGRIVGRLLLAVEPAALRVVDVALLPQWRGRGIGALVLSHVQARAARVALPVVLSVREGNRARGLYERIGFRPLPSRVEPARVFLALRWDPPASIINESKETSCPSHS